MKVYKKFEYQGYHKEYKYNMVVGNLDVYFNKKDYPELLKLLFITGSLDADCRLYKGKDGSPVPNISWNSTLLEIIRKLK